MKKLVFNLMWAPVVVLIAMFTLAFPPPATAQNPTCTQVVAEYATFTSCLGNLNGGSRYGIQIPDDWNGTVVLFSADVLGPIFNFVGDSAVRRWLLENGYAIAGSSMAGWCIREILPDQIETLDRFSTQFGAPARTITMGGSRGGLISAALVQRYPERFSGALTMDAPLAGSVAFWNQVLDFGFVIQQLIGAGSGLEIVHITNPAGNLGLAVQLINQAQSTPEGRARIALACAIVDIPAWFNPTSAEPAADDHVTRQYNHYLWAIHPLVTAFAFGPLRVDVETRAAGNPSWNTGVNYERLLENSQSAAEIQTLYAAAGLSLEDDLALLKAAARIEADPEAVEFLIPPNGVLGGVPVLAVTLTGDVIIGGHIHAYRSAALKAQNAQLLRTAFIHRAGHGPFTPAENIAAFQALVQRIETGTWNDLASPEALNASALALGAFYNVLPLGGSNRPAWNPDFFEYEPSPFPRPYDIGEAPIHIPEVRGIHPAANQPANEAPLNTIALKAWPLPYRGGMLNLSLNGAMTHATEVTIHDLGGRRVRGLTRGSADDSFQWDGRDEGGASVRNGIYFLRALDGGRSAQVRFAVLR